MNLGGPGLAQKPDHMRCGGAADDAVINHDDPLAGDHLGQGIEFLPHAQVSHPLFRFDKRPADVAVLYQAFTERNTRLPGVANRRRG